MRILDADCKPSCCFRRVPALARGASCEFTKLTTFLWFSVVDGAGAGSVLGILFVIDDLLVCFVAGGGAGAWSVLRILFVIDDLLVLCGGWRRWRVARPQIFFNYLSTTLSWFLAGGRRWRVERARILFAINDPLVV